MAAQRIDIEQFLELARIHPVIDVRSPGEYTHAHLPGAHSMPLFSDEERKVVGTTYKQISREAAIKTGLDYFGPKMRPMVEQVEAILKNSPYAVASAGKPGSQLPTPDSILPSHSSRTILVYCWRGGMRSGAVSWLLDMYGFSVYTLTGGYKRFRNHVLNSFTEPYRFNILSGFTGSGKTELLKTLKEKGEQVIDLEDLAKHKGSAFGNIGMPEQPTQEMFENLLYMELAAQANDSRQMIQGSKPIWLEDESQRIGLVNIPSALWKTMRRSPVYYLDIPFEERLKHIVPEYGVLDRERLIGAITRISEKLGHLQAKTAISLLNEGKITESFAILLSYYDKFYFRSLHNRENLEALLHTVKTDSVSASNAEILLREARQKEPANPA